MVRYQDLGLIEFRRYDPTTDIESWQSLVHVCRRWRGLVLGSPRRLDLRLDYEPGRSANKTLDVWPALPILIGGGVSESEASVGRVIAGLEHRDRICEIALYFHTTSRIDKIWTTMQVPFPELATLKMSFSRGLSYEPAFPDSILGGSAPRLQFLELGAIPFPGLPSLLLSTTQLVHLWLFRIPHSGYISPEAMATCLSTLTSLETLQLGFESPQSCPDQENRRPTPPTRSILPVLTFFWFKGVNEYLEDLVSWIDSPRLDKLSTTFFNDIDYNTPELNQFISRTPTLRAYDEARLIFHNREAQVRLRQIQPERSAGGFVEIKIVSQVSNWQLSSLAQIYTLSSHLFFTIENLYIHENLSFPPKWKDDIENIEWLDLLLPFAAVKNLYLSEQFTPRVAPALQELTGGRTTEVLPTLQNLFLEGFQPSEPVHEGIARFISARQLTNRPFALSVWERDLTQETFWTYYGSYSVL